MRGGARREQRRTALGARALLLLHPLCVKYEPSAYLFARLVDGFTEGKTADEEEGSEARQWRARDKEQRAVGRRSSFDSAVRGGVLRRPHGLVEGKGVGSHGGKRGEGAAWRCRSWRPCRRGHAHAHTLPLSLHLHLICLLSLGGTLGWCVQGLQCTKKRKGCREVSIVRQGHGVGGSLVISWGFVISPAFSLSCSTSSPACARRAPRRRCRRPSRGPRAPPPPPAAAPRGRQSGRGRRRCRRRRRR